MDNDFIETASEASFNALTKDDKTQLKENNKKDAKELFFIQQEIHEIIF